MTPDDSNKEYGLIKSFDVDHGELDGFAPHQCFVLGYELAMLDHMLGFDLGIQQPVHAANAGRIRKSCADKKRDFKLTWMPEDSSEEWMFLEVSPK